MFVITCDVAVPTTANGRADPTSSQGRRQIQGMGRKGSVGLGVAQGQNTNRHFGKTKMFRFINDPFNAGFLLPVRK